MQQIPEAQMFIKKGLSSKSVCQEATLRVFEECEVKKALLEKENTGRNTSIQAWEGGKAVQGQN